MSPSPINKHQILGKNLLYEIESQLRMTKKSGCSCTVLYESDWIISEQDILRPDVSILCDKVDLNGFIRTPPTLIVEIFSPSTRMKDRNTKFRIYQENGVKFYLMADPDLKKVEVFELIDNQYKEMPDKTDFQLTKTCLIHLDYEELFIDL